MSIQSEINRITGEVNTQTSALASIESQLAQALTLLDGKAAGGGGGIQPCTVTVSFTGNAAGYGEYGEVKYQYAKVVSGGTEMVQGIMNADNMVFSDVLANSIFSLSGSDFAMFTCTPTNTTKYTSIYGSTVSTPVFLVGTEPVTIAYS